MFGFARRILGNSSEKTESEWLGVTRIHLSYDFKEAELNFEGDDRLILDDVEGIIFKPSQGSICVKSGSSSDVDCLLTFDKHKKVTKDADNFLRIDNMTYHDELKLK